MNISTAMLSGLPFTNKDIIGAYWYDKSTLTLYHRDNVQDYLDYEWIRQHCSPSPMGWFSAYDLVRNNWYIV